ncbi:MAG: Universal stress protein family [bacterium]|jgi:nucleotide-binding universal stress UspA family protein
MTVKPPDNADRGPILLCAGTDPGAAARLAEGAATLLADAAAELLAARGMRVTTSVRPQECAPWQEILELADEIDASVIVAGAGESPAPRAGSLGAQVRALAHRTRRPLLVLPPDGTAAAPGAPALLAYDGSSPARRAISAAATLLRPRPAVVVRAWHSVAPVIAVERDAAVVVAGTRGHSRFAAALLGSNAESIVRHAGRPVLLVPGMNAS